MSLLFQRLYIDFFFFFLVLFTKPLQSGLYYSYFEIEGPVTQWGDKTSPQISEQLYVAESGPGYSAGSIPCRLPTTGTAVTFLARIKHYYDFLTPFCQGNKNLSLFNKMFIEMVIIIVMKHTHAYYFYRSSQKAHVGLTVDPKSETHRIDVTCWRPRSY